MAKYATKAKENIFTQARYNAAKFNDRLNSREGASEELGIDRSRLARIELGSKNPFPDEVLMMSDIYNAPELKAHFCKYMCPLGKDFPEVESEDLDRISVKALSSFRKISKAKDLLLDITEDGMITEEEMVMGLRAQCSQTNIVADMVPAILMAHYTVPGCNMESGQTSFF